MKRRFWLTNTSQRGDTIVEVLIVLTVLSLAFAISVSTANRSLVKSRNSEEHSQALGALSTQVELVRSARSKQVSLPTTGSFCMTSPTTFDTTFAAGYSFPAHAKADDFTKYPSSCYLRGYYYVSVQYDPATENFNFTVRWDGSSKLGRQQEQISYRDYKLTPGLNTIPVVGSAVGLTVSAKVIPPIVVSNGFDTPNCSSAASWTKDGISVTINQVNGSQPPQSSTTVASVVLFSNVIEGGVYKAIVTAPAGFEVCPPNPSGAKLVPVGGSPQIDMKIRPICYDVTITDPDVAIYGPWYNVGHQPIYNDYSTPNYGPVYYTIGARRTDLDRRHAEWNSPYYPFSDKPATFIEGGIYYSRVSGGSDWSYNAGGPFYNAWNADAHQDIVSWTSHHDLIGYTPDDWRHDFIRWDHRSHIESQCPA